MTGHKQQTTGVKREYIFAVFVLGFISIATQIILLREFLSFFYGNELVIGLILTNWMLLTGLGAYVGKNAKRMKNKVHVVLINLSLLAVMPLLLVFLMYYIRDVVFLPGTLLDIADIFFSSFIVLLPFCFISGFTFTALCYIISETAGENRISHTYSWESQGSIAGGILFNLLLVWFLETFHSLLFLGLLSLGVLLYVSIYLKKYLSLALVFLFASALVVAFIFYNPDLLTRKFLYKDQEIEHYKSTPYGNIVVTKTGNQLNFFENNMLLFSSNQPANNEETVHFTMVQHSKPRNVLLLSAGLPGVVKEVLKYNINQVDYVEINPWLTKSLQKYSSVYEDDRVHIIHKDARNYVEQTNQKYDVVLIGVPEPNTIQLNRFYTHEFYTSLKSILTSNGVISFGISGSSNYLSEETVNLYSSLRRTLNDHFRHIAIIPGNQNYFLASDAALTYAVTQKIEQKNIETRYVNKYYLQDELLEQRAKLMQSQLKKDIDENEDFRPYTYTLKIRQWLGQFQFNFWIPLFGLGFAAIYLLFLLHPVNRGMFLAGFSGASLEIILLVSFQILFGAVFQIVGIIITIFMAGLAFGTYYRHLFMKHVTLSNYYNLQYFMALKLLLLPVFLYVFKEYILPPLAIKVLFGVLMFMSATLVGMVFSVASTIRLRKLHVIASEVYSVDLLGAALGSLLVSVYLIPLVGIFNVCWILGGLMLLSGFISSFQFNQVKI